MSMVALPHRSRDGGGGGDRIFFEDTEKMHKFDKISVFTSQTA
jgi:hypothetical protein